MIGLLLFIQQKSIKKIVNLQVFVNDFTSKVNPAKLEGFLVVNSQMASLLIQE